MKKILILTTTVLFVIIATQAMLFIHIVSEKHNHEHDSDKCEVCRLLLTLPQIIKVEEHITVLRYPHFEHFVTYSIDVPHAISILSALCPRAPPAYL